jgi:hypothetical protein
MTSVPDTLQMRAGTLGTVVGAMWVIHVLDVLVPGAGSVLGHGIVPRTLTGLEAIPAAPWIHGSFSTSSQTPSHFSSSAVWSCCAASSSFVFVVLTCLIIAGAGTWAFGAGNTQHIGASGIVFGLFGYLLLRTVFDRRLSSAAITLVVAAVYGAAMIRSIIPASGISWSAHFFGFIGGVLAARLRHVERARSS